SGVTELGEHERAFVEWVDSGKEREWGELVVTAREDGYELRNVADSNDEELESYDVDEAKNIAKFDDDANYRPLKGEKSLASDWKITGLSDDELTRAIDYIYSASIANWHLEREDELDVTSWEETAERQTGIYDIVDELEGDELSAAVESICGNCVKRCEWYDSEDTTNSDIPCREACSFFIAGAREFVKMDLDSDTEEVREPAEDVRAGEFSNPANEYRRRFLWSNRQRKHESHQKEAET
ncbi:MAG: DR2241 family protein, partial [Halobacteria archaeon]|nr:DR2241 family protein [Halobacteria archaeon]